MNVETSALQSKLWTCLPSGKEGQGRPHRACWLEDLRVFREITLSKARQLCLNSVGACYLDVSLV